ncbi:MAG: hypothetical protein L6R38_003261 [Xanthoria sp. 2 TBL-2021]|nr:MAG: hypothetical protein L6R38_003261 [Xanthoria sp. 2 TBL-2021]
MKPLLAGPEKVMAIDVVQDIPDTLKLHNIHLSTINAIIWSHSHIDHIGDPSDFPPTTELVVGPGFKAHSILAYPSNPNSPLLDDAFQGRSIREVDFSNSTTTVSGFRAIDYFGDTSFWLLEAPGHTAHHICALCRTTGDSWILLGGDACHHPTCDTVAKAMQSSRSEADLKEAEETLERLKAFDGRGDVMVIIAHDSSWLDVLDFFARDLNNWKAKGWDSQGRWLFLGEFL